MDGEIDVVVCDGFVGNVVLKLTEGVAKTLLGMLKKIFLQNIITKLSYLGIKGGLGELKRMMDSEVGGAPLLGAASRSSRHTVPARPRASRTLSARPSCALPTTCAARWRMPWPQLPKQKEKKQKTA